MKHRKPWSSCVCGLSIVLLHKLAIYCDYLWYILCATNFYVPVLRYGKIVKPTVERVDAFLSHGNIVGVAILTLGIIWGLNFPRGDDL
jgi:hypothetical protein